MQLLADDLPAIVEGLVRLRLRDRGCCIAGAQERARQDELRRVASFGRKLNFVRATKVLDEALAAF